MDFDQTSCSEKVADYGGVVCLNYSDTLRNSPESLPLAGFHLLGGAGGDLPPQTFNLSPKAFHESKFNFLLIQCVHIIF